VGLIQGDSFFVQGKKGSLGHAVAFLFGIEKLKQGSNKQKPH